MCVKVHKQARKRGRPIRQDDPSMRCTMEPRHGKHPTCACSSRRCRTNKCCRYLFTCFYRKRSKGQMFVGWSVYLLSAGKLQRNIYIYTAAVNTRCRDPATAPIARTAWLAFNRPGHFRPHSSRSRLLRATSVNSPSAMPTKRLYGSGGCTWWRGRR